MYKVQKKDGTLEEFDRDKILMGLQKSGCTPDEAQKVADEIEVWMPTAAENNVVKSQDIRVKGLEALKLVNPEIAAKFEAFQKPAQAA